MKEVLTIVRIQTSYLQQTSDSFGFQFEVVLRHNQYRQQTIQLTFQTTHQSRRNRTNNLF